MPNNKILNNAKWIIGCKALQSVIQLVIGMLSARYLGPTNYGLIDYAASIVAFAVPVMQLGFPSTLVQEYIKTPEREGQILGSHLMLNMVTAVACVIGVASFAAAANPGDTDTLFVCTLYSVSMFFQALDILQYWFQAKLLSKYSSLAMLFGYLVVSAYKVYLLISGKSVYWFALSHAVEFGSLGILLLIAYMKQGTQKISFSGKLAKEMFSRSKYYIVASLMLVVFNRISGVLLTQMIGKTENGYYAAAVTCSCITSFVFNAILDTARPVIVESREESKEKFEKNVSRLYAVTTYLSLAQSAVYSLLAGLIVRVLYGKTFLEAIPVLQILVWNLSFSYMGSVRNIWILGEQKYNTLWVINLCGALTSITLNVCMIPLWGACGAALASVLTQFFTNFVMGFIYKPIRENNRLLLKGLDPRLLFEMAKMLKSRPQDG